jgi:hypothetical protein
MSRDDVPQTVKQEIGTRKFMLTVLWGVDGFCVVDVMPERHSYNTQYFLDNILQAILQEIFPDGWSHTLVGSVSIWTIVAFTAPKPLTPSSLKTGLFKCLIQSIAQTWHRRTFGFSIT